MATLIFRQTASRSCRPLVSLSPLAGNIQRVVALKQPLEPAAHGERLFRGTPPGDLLASSALLLLAGTPFVFVLPAACAPETLSRTAWLTFVSLRPEKTGQVLLLLLIFGRSAAFQTSKLTAAPGLTRNLKSEGGLLLLLLLSLMCWLPQGAGDVGFLLLQAGKSFIFSWSVTITLLVRLCPQDTEEVGVLNAKCGRLRLVIQTPISNRTLRFTAASFTSSVLTTTMLLLLLLLLPS